MLSSFLANLKVAAYAFMPSCWLGIAVKVSTQSQNRFFKDEHKHMFDYLFCSFLFVLSRLFCLFHLVYFALCCFVFVLFFISGATFTDGMVFLCAICKFPPYTTV